MKKKLLASTCLLSLALLLGTAACKPSNVPVAGKALDGFSGMRKDTEKRLSTAAHNAILEGKTAEALELYEKLYEKNQTTPAIVLNYAQLLRKSGKAEKALDVLKPVVAYGNGRLRSDLDPILINEYAATHIELGHYDEATDLLDKVLENKEAAAYHADAYNLMGIALDAQGQHKEAEQSYRQALQGWKGDPTAVMNNLGLCLAAQGLFDESLTTLRQALLQAPQKEEIARNVQMVSDLRKSLLPTAPIDVTSSKK